LGFTALIILLWIKILRRFIEVKGDYGISKEMKPSTIPSSVSNIGDSINSETGGKYIEYKMKQEGLDK